MLYPAKTLPMRFIVSVLITFLLYSSFHPATAQSCESTVVIVLTNIQGGFFTGQKVTLIARSDSSIYTQTSSERGEATFSLPCSELFDISISNYAKKPSIESPKENGMIKQSFTYAPDM